MFGCFFVVSFIFSLILLYLIYKVRDSLIAKYLLICTSMISFWFLLEALTFFIKDADISYWFQIVEFPTIMFIPPMFYLITVEHMTYSTWFSKKRYWVLIVPIISLLSFMTNKFPYRFYTGSKLTYIEGIPFFTYIPEIGFNINAFYLYGIVTIALFMFAIKVFKLPKLYRRQNIFILIGSLISFISNILVIIFLFGSPYFDVTSIFMLITMAIFYVGIFRIPKLSVVPIARELLVENLTDMAIITDLLGNLIDMNPAALDFAKENISEHFKNGFNTKNIVGKRMDQVLEFIPQKVLNENILSCDENISFKGVHRDYEFRLYQSSIFDEDNSTIGYLYMLQDITEKNKSELALQKLAYYDQLTGFGNKNLFYKEIDETLQYSIRTNRNSMFVIIDIDDFNIINDSLGHTAGDEIIKETATRLRRVLDNNAFIARFSGDQFYIIIYDVKNMKSRENYMQSLLEIFHEQFIVDGNAITLTVSIGATTMPKDDLTVEGIVRKTDAALNEAKEEGKNRYLYFNEEIEKRSQEILDMKLQMEQALKNNEFSLFLQPQIAYVENHYKVVGAEALIRWIRDGKIIYTPDKFIGLAEMNGMIVPIGSWIIDEIFRINKSLFEKGIEIKLSINVSSKQLEGDCIVRHLKRLINDYKDVPIDLVIEITESFLLNTEEDTIEYLNSIKKLGVGIALDDFGTGFSSLSYLRKLPLDYLKIDKSFIDDVVVDDLNLTPHIISMAKTLGLQTIAEGTENNEQVEVLTKDKCDYFQGYYFSKPLDENSFIQYASIGSNPLKNSVNLN